MAVEQEEAPPPTVEELRRAARELYDVIITHCKNCTDCKLNDAGRPVVKPGYCDQGATLRVRYEAAYRSWFFRKNHPAAPQDSHRRAPSR